MATIKTQKSRVTKKQSIKKVVEAHNRRVEKDNAAFEKMSPAEKRVQIARDVISQLHAKRLIAEPGTWLTGTKSPLFNNVNIKNNPEVKDLFSEVKECRGCALGGMFMCAVERANKLKYSQLESMKGVDVEDDEEYTYDSGDVSQQDTFSYMKKFFTRHQLELIEAAFEQGCGSVGSRSPAHEDAVDFACEIDNPELRMRLIMENIIANQGIFKPKQKPVIIYQTPGFLG